MNKLQYKLKHMKLRWKLFKQMLIDDEDFDYEYMLLLIRRKLDCMAHYFRNEQWIYEADTYAKEIETASKLIDIYLRKDTDSFDEDWNCKVYVNTKNVKRFTINNIEAEMFRKYPEDLRSEKARCLLVHNIDRFFNWCD